MMAGQKFVKDFNDLGVPIIRIIENGNVQPDDEWALFRLTDGGLEAYKMGYELAAGIMFVEVDGKRAVQEIARHKSKEEAVTAMNELSPEERERTLLRSVKPK